MGNVAVEGAWRLDFGHHTHLKKRKVSNNNGVCV
jgi:hypothetical protein